MNAEGHLSLQGCLERAVSIKETARSLRSADDEWFAVCYFYAAYHTVKAALLEDPLFEDPAALSTRSRHLTPDDRYATHHQARLGKGPRKLGVNDIVRVLYPNIAVEYVRLHMASIDVRCNSGLTTIAGSSVEADYEALIAAYVGGHLRG